MTNNTKDLNPAAAAVLRRAQETNAMTFEPPATPPRRTGKVRSPRRSRRRIIR